MPNRIRVRLLLSYLFLSLNLIVLAGATLYYSKRAESLRNSQNKILEADIKLQKLINTDLVIINRETVRNDFFKTGTSPLLSEHHVLIDEIKSRIAQIRDLENSTVGENLLAGLDDTLVKYDENFSRYIHIVVSRGFRDFGLEGKMRDQAHLLEQMDIITKEELLYLRRHEKDFFLRKDTLYVHKFNDLCEELKSRHLHNTRFTAEQQLLESYCILFNEIAKIDIALGFSESEGYRGVLHSHVLSLEMQFALLLKSSREITEKKLHQGEFLFYVLIAISLALSILMSVYFSIQIAKPVKELARSMDNFMVDTQSPMPLPRSQAYDTEEIQVLWQSFYHMSTAIRKQFEEIKEKSDLLENQNARLNKLNKELDQFIYSASHDLKAPLSSLLGLIDLLRSGDDPDEHKEYFQLMEGSIKRLENHIKDIILYSKNHQLDVAIQQIRLKTTIESIIDQLKFQKGSEKIQIQIDIKEKLGFYSDPMRLNMILFNLISNAFKYHDNAKASQTIVISATINATMVHITIMDNGMGIGSEHLHRIFDLFYRASEKSKGSGLGLFIAKEALDKLGGSIEVESNEGTGSTFSLAIPNLFAEA